MKIKITVDEDGSDEVNVHSEFDLNCNINAFIGALDNLVQRISNKVADAAIAKGATEEKYEEIVLQIKFSDIDSL